MTILPARTVTFDESQAREIAADRAQRTATYRLALELDLSKANAVLPAAVAALDAARATFASARTEAAGRALLRAVKAHRRAVARVDLAARLLASL